MFHVWVQKGEGSEFSHGPCLVHVWSEKMGGMWCPVVTVQQITRLQNTYKAAPSQDGFCVRKGEMKSKNILSKLLSRKLSRPIFKQLGSFHGSSQMSFRSPVFNFTWCKSPMKRTMCDISGHTLSPSEQWGLILPLHGVESLKEICRA